MAKRSLVLIISLTLVAGSMQAQSPGGVKRAPGGYIVQQEADIAKTEPGTHNGGGQTVGYSFFDRTPGLTLVFRKRALKPGSAIGYHEQREDEIYYVLSGRGA